MNDEERCLAAHQALDDRGPDAALLTPEVRSGASFVFTGTGSNDIPAFVVAWVYAVDPDQHGAFVQKVDSFENTVAPPQGVFYKGTYSVTVSSAAPDYAYRTFWGLETLARIEALNNYLATAPQALKEVMDLVKPGMRMEIMGRTKNAASPFGH